MLVKAEDEWFKIHVKNAPPFNHISPTLYQHATKLWGSQTAAAVHRNQIPIKVKGEKLKLYYTG